MSPNPHPVEGQREQGDTCKQGFTQHCRPHICILGPWAAFSLLPFLYGLCNTFNKYVEYLEKVKIKAVFHDMWKSYGTLTACPYSHRCWYLFKRAENWCPRKNLPTDACSSSVHNRKTWEAAKAPFGV